MIDSAEPLSALPLPLPVPVSVLDRSRIRTGESAAGALRATVALAREVEALGYRRFWVSEHHAVPGVAGSAPAVLAAAVASATSRIRVGTGGVMLPNHQPLVVAEQFGVLEALFPGRVDMGLGRSLGFTGAVRRALGRERGAEGDFAAQLAELLGYFTAEGVRGVRARPSGELGAVPAFVLATGPGESTLAAASLGLPLVVAAARGESALVGAVEQYREAFRPSERAERSEQPYVLVAADIAIASTAAEARDLLLPEAWSAVYSRTHGDFSPLLPVSEIRALRMTARERALVEESLDSYGRIHGTEPEVRDQLAGLLKRTEADELLATTSTFDRSALLECLRRLARPEVT